MDAIPQQHIPGADERLAEAVKATRLRPRKTDAEIMADVLAQFGGEYQITAEGFCYVAVRRPTPTVQEVIVGHDVRELLVKLQAERDGS